MLEAGYFLPKRAFFDNICTILTYAVIGTIFNALAIEKVSKAILFHVKMKEESKVSFFKYFFSNFKAKNKLFLVWCISCGLFPRYWWGNVKTVGTHRMLAFWGTFKNRKFSIFHDIVNKYKNQIPIRSIMSAIDPVTVIAVFQEIHVNTGNFFKPSRPINAFLSLL